MTGDRGHAPATVTVGGIDAPQKPPNRRSRIAIGALVAIALVLGVVVATNGSDDSGSGRERRAEAPSTSAATPESNAHVADTMGFYTGSPNTHGLDEFFEREEWLDHSISSFTAFGDGTSLEGFRRNATAQFRADRLGQWVAAGEQPPFRLVYMLPLAFGEPYGQSDDVAKLVEQQWDALIDGRTVGRRHPHAAGLNLEWYRDFAADLVDLGYGNAIIRLGSEHDIQGSRWASEIDPERFKEAYRSVVGAMRDAAPDLTFDYTSILLNFGTGAEPGEKVTEAYPGDDYVDYIGIDVYDQGDVGSDIGVPDGDHCGWRDPEAVFDSYHATALETARRYAVTRGKPLSLPEWGLSGGGRGDDAKLAGQCGGDNPVFVERMHGFLASLPTSGPGSLGYHSYFEGNPAHDGPHALAEFPTARERFRELFGGPQ